jgi:hypothetical protein
MSQVHESESLTASQMGVFERPNAYSAQPESHAKIKVWPMRHYSGWLLQHYAEKAQTSGETLFWPH